MAVRAVPRTEGDVTMMIVEVKIRPALASQCEQKIVHMEIVNKGADSRPGRADYDVAYIEYKGQDKMPYTIRTEIENYVRDQGAATLVTLALSKVLREIGQREARLVEAIINDVDKPA